MDIFGIRYGSFWDGIIGGAPAITTFNVDSSTDALEFYLSSRTADPITHLGVYYAGKTGTCPDYVLGLQGITSQRANGTYLGGSANAKVQFNPQSLGWAAASWHWLALGESYTPAYGDYLCGTLQPAAGATVDASNFATFGSSISSLAGNYPNSVSVNAGVATRGTSVPVFGYRTASGRFGFPINKVSSQTFNSGSSPNEHAIRFTPPDGLGDTFKVGGLGATMGIPASGHDLTVKLYDSGGTLLLSKDFEAGYAASSTARQNYFPLGLSNNLNFGSKYYVSILPKDTTNQTVYYFEVAEAADWDAWAFGQTVGSATINGGVITDNDLRRYSMSVDLRAWAEPTVGGGGGVSGPVGVYA